MNWKTIIKKTLIGYFGFLIVLYIFQSWFLYHPRTFDAYEEIDLKKIHAVVVSDNDLEWLFLPSRNTSNKTLIYFHGNAGAAIDRAYKAEAWRQNGFNVVLAEYPRYGTNDGRRTETNFFTSGRIIIDKTMESFPGTQLYIYGESIGSGTAVQMASEYDEKALVIEGGFSSLIDVVQNTLPFIPARFLLRDQYDNISKINQIDSRLIVIHGVKDNVVRFKFGQKLYDEFQGDKDFLKIDDAGHNDIYSIVDMNAEIKRLNL
jgi:fermentation-respiration switch protein FrsA (DUF1100 family)